MTNLCKNVSPPLPPPVFFGLGVRSLKDTICYESARTETKDKARVGTCAPAFSPSYISDSFDPLPVSLVSQKACGLLFVVVNSGGWLNVDTYVWVTSLSVPTLGWAVLMIEVGCYALRHWQWHIGGAKGTVQYVIGRQCCLGSGSTDDGPSGCSFSVVLLSSLFSLLERLV